MHHNCGSAPVRKRSGPTAIERKAFFNVRSISITAAHPSVCETRGLGLLRAIDLAADAGFGPADLLAAARERGLLLVRGGERAVRLLPPLTVTDDDIHDALAALDEALATLESTLHPKGKDTK